jgi:lactate dehydrogenase-like 2-hydroxyacid dehydrogenase
LLGSVSGELGLRKYLESNGHTFVVTSDKDGPGSRFERELPDADVVISQPFWPAYLTAERIAKAKKLKLAVTAGIGSDHVDLQAAIDRKITVAEVTYSNSISVAEHVVMMILGLVRNYIPSYQWVVKGGWNIADCVERSYDVEGMHVGTVAAGRIGLAVLRRLKPFDMHLHYYERQRLPEAVENELGLAWHPNVEDMVKVCDVVTINAPLHPETENLFNDKLLSRMKRGAYLVNTARAKICDRDANRPSPRKRPPRRLRRRRVVPATGARGSSLADHAASRHDATYFRNIAVGAGSIRRRNKGNPRVLLRGAADPQRIPHRGWRQARRHGGAFLQRRRRNARIRGGGKIPEG